MGCPNMVPPREVPSSSHFYILNKNAGAAATGADAISLALAPLRCAVSSASSTAHGALPSLHPPRPPSARRAATLKMES